MPVSIPIKFEIIDDKNKIEELAQKANELHGPDMVHGIQRATNIVQNHAKIEAPVDTGRLRGSITSQINVRTSSYFDPVVEGIVGTNVKYGLYMEAGTKPHMPPISALETWARRHHTTAWSVALAIAKHGTKPRNYFDKAFKIAAPKVEKIIGGVVSGIVNKMGD